MNERLGLIRGGEGYDLDRRKVKRKSEIKLANDMERPGIHREDRIGTLRETAKADVSPGRALQKFLKLLVVRLDLIPQPLEMFVVARALTQRGFKKPKIFFSDRAAPTKRIALAMRVRCAQSSQFENCLLNVAKTPKTQAGIVAKRQCTSYERGRLSCPGATISEPR